jgi:hypothetical protein
VRDVADSVSCRKMLTAMWCSRWLGWAGSGSLIGVLFEATDGTLTHINICSPSCRLR